MVNPTRLTHRGSALLTAAFALGLAACAGDDDNAPPPVSSATDGDTDPTSTTLTTSSATSTSETGSGTQDETSDGTTGDATGTASETGSSTSTSEDTGNPANCGAVVCKGHGSCKVLNGLAQCVCDDGYVLNEDETECLVDESCVQLRFLEDHCRQIYNDVPAVGLFFAVDFCSGTAVTPEKFDELGLEFQVLENDVDITENVESSHQVINKDVESYVAIVLDVSKSLVDSGNLPTLTAALTSLIDDITPDDGSAMPHVAIYVFGRQVFELRRFSPDLVALKAALEGIASDPDSTQNLVGGDGTALYEATKRGIQGTERIRQLREIVSEGGVLTTGTVVVVTDGKDSSNATLDTALIGQTINNLISVGIGYEITDEDLEAIGRDGSFLAPDPEDWQQAFQEIGERIRQYPERSYLLAYCSSASFGQPVVEVSMKGNVTVRQTASCAFDANLFGVELDDICTLEYFDEECDSAQCGGLTACGACPNDGCCASGQCTAPGPVPATCDASNAVCLPADQICDTGADTCVNPSALGEACGAGCEPGVGYCDAELDECVPTKATLTTCTDAAECVTLRCDRINPNNPLTPRVCLEGGGMWDACDSGKIVCEPGTYCDGTRCVPQKGFLETCPDAGACRSGVCEEPQPNEASMCMSSGICYFTWFDKVPS